MAVKVAINGFGRIGRLAFRQMFGAEGYEVVAINDLTKPSMLAHLLKYDTAQGGYCGKIGEGLHTVEADDEANTITVDGKTLKIYAEKDAKDLPWGEIGVDVVLECTGFYTSKAKSQAHIDAGAKKVVISAPAGNDLPTIVYSVNEKTLTADDTIISAASCTTNCLAPMAKALNDYAPIQSGIMSTIHAYTGDQMILDGPHRKGDLRRARAGAANIVPNSTGAAKAIGLVIPELNGKLIGSAQRVPVPTGSTTILTAVVKGTDITKEGINAAMKAAASESFGYNEDQIVSSDVIGMKYAPCSTQRRRWLRRSRTTSMRFRSFPGTTTRTPTRARWSERSSISLKSDFFRLYGRGRFSCSFFFACAALLRRRFEREGFVMQERVRQFLLRNGIECGAEYRCLDLASEVGEVAKEILRGSSYGKEPYAPTPETEEELGDCLFSLLALCCALNVDAQQALERVLEKYEARLRKKGSAGSR